MFLQSPIDIRDLLKFHCFIFWHFYSKILVIQGHLEDRWLGQRAQTWGTADSGWPGDLGARGHRCWKAHGPTTGNQSGTGQFNLSNMHQLKQWWTTQSNLCLHFFNMWPGHNRTTKILSFGLNKNAWKLSTLNFEPYWRDRLF